jgi:hypothetical protein
VHLGALAGHGREDAPGLVDHAAGEQLALHLRGREELAQVLVEQRVVWGKRGAGRTWRGATVD